VNPAVWGRGRQVDGVFFRGLAITLQSFARMVAARRAVAHLRAAQASRRAAANAAMDRAAAVAALTRVNCCRRIQRCWMVFCLAVEARMAATVIQALWRGFAAHRRITAVRIVVSGVSRLRFAQLAARRATTATPVQIWVATKLQAWGRMLAARRLLARSRLAAVLIQARFRAYALRRDFEWYKGACLAIQGAWRACGARRRAAKVAAGEAARLATGIQAVTRLQAVWHGRLERSAVSAVLRATTGVVTALQARWRGMLGRRAAGALRRQTELQRELMSAATATGGRSTAVPAQDVYHPLRQARRVVERAPVPCSPQVDAVAALALAVTSPCAEATVAAKQSAYEAQLLASAEVEGLRAARVSAALVIARACGRAFAGMSADREAYLTKRGFAMLLQTLVRGWMARRHVAVLRTSLPPAPFAACLSLVVEEGEGDVSLAFSFASAAPAVVVAELRVPTAADREAAARTVQASWAAFKAVCDAADAAMAAARHIARVAAGGATITVWVRLCMRSARRARLAERVRAAVHEARRRATLAQRLAGVLGSQVADTAAARAAVRAAAEAKAAAQLSAAGQAIWAGGAQAGAFAASRNAVRSTASRGAAEAAMVAAARAAARSMRRESAAAAAALGATMTTARAAKREASSKAAAAAEGFGGPRKQQWSIASPRSRMLAAQGAKAQRSTAIPPRKEAGQAAAASALLFAARRTATSAAVQAAVWTDRRRFYDAARAIQTAWRACEARMVASIRRGSVLLLQSWVRGAKARSVARMAAIEAAAASAEGEAEAEQCVGHAMQRSREAAEAALLSSPLLPSPAAPSSRAADDEVETVADDCAPTRAERVEEEADLMSEVYALAARVVQRKWRSVMRGDAPDVASALAHARRMRAGRARLAALVRGACTRSQQLAVRPTLPIVHVRMRLAVATRDRAKGHTRTLGARTASALASVAATRSLADVMTACEDLEVATRLAPSCARALVAVNAAPTLYAVMNACGRATAHAQLVRRILAVLRNVAAQVGADRRPLARSLATADACSTLLAVMAAHSDALPVLRPALDLLTTLVEAHPERRAAAVLAVAPVAQIRNLRAVYAKKAALVAAATGGAAPSAEAARVLAGVDSGREGFSLPGTLRELDRLLAVFGRPPPAAVATRPAGGVPAPVAAAASLPLSPRAINAARANPKAAREGGGGRHAPA